MRRNGMQTKFNKDRKNFANNDGKENEKEKIENKEKGGKETSFLTRNSGQK